MDNNAIIAALHDELHDVVKYMDMARGNEYGSILRDIAAEEMQHAKNLKAILKMSGAEIPDMAVEWHEARHALYDENLS